MRSLRGATGVHVRYAHANVAGGERQPDAPGVGAVDRSATRAAACGVQLDGQRGRLAAHGAEERSVALLSPAAGAGLADDVPAGLHKRRAALQAHRTRRGLAHARAVRVPVFLSFPFFFVSLFQIRAERQMQSLANHIASLVSKLEIEPTFRSDAVPLACELHDALLQIEAHVFKGSDDDNIRHC